MINKILHDEKIMRIARYVVVGGLTTVISFIIFLLFEKLLKLDTNLSNIISVISGVIFAYITNKIIVFKSRCGNYRALIKEALSFFAARAFTILFEIGGVFVLYSIIGIDSVVSKAVITIAVIILNYFLSKLFVFK